MPSSEADSDVASPDASTPAGDAAALLYRASLEFAGTGEGVIRSSNSALNCGSRCDAEVEPGPLRLSAYADHGSTFSHWEGACSGTDPVCELEVVEDLDATAVFEVRTVTISVEKATRGRATISDTLGKAIGERLSCGDVCSARYPFDTRIGFRPELAFDSRIDGWEGACESTNFGCTMTALTDGIVRPQLFLGRVAVGPGSDFGRDVAVGPNGDVLVVGQFSETLRFGSTSLKKGFRRVRDGFMLQLTPEATAARFGRRAFDSWDHVDVDQLGRAVAGGSFTSTIRVEKFGGTSNSWSRSSSGGNTKLVDLVVGPDDEVIVAGWFQSTVSVAGRTLETNGGSDFFLAKFSTEGAVRWVVSYGAALDEHPRGLAVDGAGNAILVGDVITRADFGSGELVAGGPDDGSVRRDGVIAKYAADTGEPLWVRQYGGDGSVGFGAVAATDNGDVIVALDLEGQADLGDGPREAPSEELILARYDTDGELVWANTAAQPSGGEASVAAKDAVAAVDDEGHVLVAGTFSGRIVVGSEELEAPDNRAVYAAKFSGDTGAPLWRREAGAAPGVSINAAATGEANRLFLIGTVERGAGAFGDHPNREVLVLPLISSDEEALTEAP